MTIPTIQTFDKKIIIGKKTRMSLVQNKTQKLWQCFMPKRNEIENTKGIEFFSIEIYDNLDFFKNFNPNNQFEKWAAVEVTKIGKFPSDFEVLETIEGEYAVFHYHGDAANAFNFYQYIYGDWLPNSKYILDKRPHFSIMGAAYKNNDPNSEEDICVPIRLK
ncbi:GyrI-like domain-containing protein [Flavicella sediminum]|uniref:GyrI-like domain-containing protein n=1 Tax=Flavicella sediminum TaxID=2585141 RepID=UPI0011241BE6|nr:GyrI-like domain-containing protein [Flavicella sediminum]